MNHIRQNEILARAIERFGNEAQFLKTIEECAELSVQLAKLLGRHKQVGDELYEEIADVEIMLRQLRIIFGEDTIEAHVSRKLKRLEGKLR